MYLQIGVLMKSFVMLFNLSLMLNKNNKGDKMVSPNEFQAKIDERDKLILESLN